MGKHDTVQLHVLRACYVSVNSKHGGPGGNRAVIKESTHQLVVLKSGTSNTASWFRAVGTRPAYAEPRVFACLCSQWSNLAGLTKGRLTDIFCASLDLQRDSSSLGNVTSVSRNAYVAAVRQRALVPSL